MYGFYTPVFVLQAFCVYHAYRNNAEQRWYWLIVFFPLVGCVIYLIHHFNTRSTIESIAENVKQVVKSNYKIEQLEKACIFSDNVTNKTALADAYVEVGRYADGISYYESALQGFMADDPQLRMKLLYAHFMNDNFEAAVHYGKLLENERLFKNSEVRVIYAWSLFHVGQVDAAASVFADMDKTFSNYYHRMEYCKFLLKTEKADLAKEKLRELVEEFEHMKGPERKLKKDTYNEIRDLYTSNVGAL